MNEKAKGYILAVIAAATYGMNPLFALPLYADGMNPDSVLFFRYLFAIPLVGVMIKGRGRDFKIHRTDILPLVVLGVLMAASSLTLFEAYNYMDAGIASTILFIYPILVALIMAAVYKEKVTMQTALCILLALSGIAMLYQGGDGATLVLLFGVSLFVVRLWMSHDLTLPTRWWLWGNLVALAVFPTAISFLCTTSAIQRIGSTPTAILGALEPVTAIFFGITVFGERLTARDCMGITLILVAVTVVVAGGSITHQLVRFRKMFPRLPLKRK